MREVMIKIPEEIYENIKNHSGVAYAVEDYLHEVEWVIKDGTPLLKGHGRLIDADLIPEYINSGKVCEGCVRSGFGCQYDCTFPDYVDYKMEKMLKDQPTIVEADNEEQRNENL